MNPRRLFVALAMIAAGVVTMYAEGQCQPEPGVGFAIALSLFMGAVLVGVRERG